MAEVKYSFSNLDKKRQALLVISIVLSLFLIASGIVTLFIPEEEIISVNRRYMIETPIGENYTLTITPEESGYYDICTYDAKILEVRTINNNTVSLSSSYYDNIYDYAYRVYFYGGYTYKIKVFTQSKTMSIIVSN